MSLTPDQLEEKYTRLKNDIIDFTSHAVSEEESTDYLAHLKEVFAVHIKSVRKLDAATSVADLIRLLEKRLLLGWFKVDPFKDILDAYEMDGDCFHRYREYVDELEKYRLKNKHIFSSYPFDPSLLKEIPANREVIPEEIVQYICTKIADDYCEFGRELVADGFVTEGQWDRLMESDIPKSEKVQQLLDWFVKGDKRTKRSQLSNVLKKVDPGLSEQVDEMFMGSYY